MLEKQIRMSDQVFITAAEVQLYDVKQINNSLTLQHEIQISVGSEANWVQRYYFMSYRNVKHCMTDLELQRLTRSSVEQLMLCLFLQYWCFTPKE